PAGVGHHRGHDGKRHHASPACGPPATRLLGRSATGAALPAPGARVRQVAPDAGGRAGSMATRRTVGPRPPQIDDLRAGSEPAWADAVGQLGPPLRAFVGLRGAADPDAVVGDVFLELARSIDRLHGDWTDLRALAFVIARRRVIDGFRASARRPVVPMDAAGLDARPAGDVEQEAMDRLERQSVLDLLAVLTPIQRDVLLLRFVSDLSIAEVAEVTATTETAVKANQRRALAALRRHLAASHAGHSDDRTLREMVDVLGRGV
ncbi:MAG: sigma-70 family RNA polymerase sigma factor, partial [Actinomycetota bacterium]